MKNTPERIYLDIEDYHEFNYNIEYVNQHKQTDEDIEYIRKDIVLDMMEQSVVKGAEHAVKGNNLFTKEQVIELMERAFYDGKGAGEIGIEAGYPLTYEDWLIQRKPFDAK